METIFTLEVLWIMAQIILAGIFIFLLIELIVYLIHKFFSR